jgi:hypothetical protein
MGNHLQKIRCRRRDLLRYAAEAGLGIEKYGRGGPARFIVTERKRTGRELLGFLNDVTEKRGEVLALLTQPPFILTRGATRRYDSGFGRPHKIGADGRFLSAQQDCRWQMTLVDDGPNCAGYEVLREIQAYLLIPWWVHTNASQANISCRYLPGMRLTFQVGGGRLEGYSTGATIVRSCSTTLMIRPLEGGLPRRSKNTLWSPRRYAAYKDHVQRIEYPTQEAVLAALADFLAVPQDTVLANVDESLYLYLNLKDYSWMVMGEPAKDFPFGRSDFGYGLTSQGESHLCRWDSTTQGYPLKQIAGDLLYHLRRASATSLFRLHRLGSQNDPVKMPEGLTAVLWALLEKERARQMRRGNVRDRCVAVG